MQKCWVFNRKALYKNQSIYNPHTDSSRQTEEFSGISGDYGSLSYENIGILKYSHANRYLGSVMFIV